MLLDSQPCQPNTGMAAVDTPGMPSGPILSTRGGNPSITSLLQRSSNRLVLKGEGPGAKGISEGDGADGEENLLQQK